MKNPHKALIALGSNLGDSEGIIQEAFQALEGLTQDTTSRSSLWKTEPVDCPEGSPSFVNAAMSFEVSSDTIPEDFLRKLLATSYTGSSAGSSVTVAGLVNGTAYSCSVTVTNAIGTSASSAATGSITPEEGIGGLPVWLLYQATQ